MTRFAAASSAAVPLHVIEAERVGAWLAGLPEAQRLWAEANGFRAGLGEALALPDDGGRIAAAALGWGGEAARRRDRFHLAAGRAKLPPGDYVLARPHPIERPEVEALGWLLAGYRFDRYKAVGGPGPRLVCPEEVDGARVEAIAAAMTRIQDLVNTPANDMGPDALEDAARALAAEYGAEVAVTRGAALIEARLPMIHAVGRAAASEPRLIDLGWGPSDAPKLTLVGKGVCFDTGGLDIKPASAMGLMKKDMGGAATALGLAQAVMALGLPVRLRVLVPAVENAISGAAMRPGDVLTSRKGLTVEINNTDAEGRLVLADALALADEDAPDLLVSLATLTGAARVALGPDLPPYFADDDALALELARAAEAVADPLWRLPFWTPYDPLIEPAIADLDNAPSGGMAGAITAALFLRRFVQAARGFVHIDLYAWTPAAKPARPKGGAAQTARALLELVETRLCRRI